MSLCPVCKMVKDFLQLNEIPYEEIKIDLNPFAFVKIIANTGMLTVPQTNINGKWIYGFDPVELIAAFQSLNNVQKPEFY